MSAKSSTGVDCWRLCMVCSGNCPRVLVIFGDELRSPRFCVNNSLDG